MSRIPIHMIMRDWDHISPLVCGDVQPEGIDLVIDRQTSMGQFSHDLSFQAAETSFSHYVIRRAQGDQSLVGLPVFPMRAFRHRCFLTRRDSGLQSFADLVGKRVGTDAWPNSGNTWSRAAIRDQQVDIWKIEWFYGAVEDVSVVKAPPPVKIDLPTNVHPIPGDKTLVAMLLAGELDALMIPFPPRDFFSPSSPLVHLIRDFRTAEQTYFQRVGFIPGIHTVTVRREIFERDPWIAPSLVKAFETSRRVWLARRRQLSDTTPWLLAELEETAQWFGDDWQPSGLEQNRKMITAFCEEELAQRLVTQPIDPAMLFADYARVVE